jgi:hypothetical protein
LQFRASAALAHSLTEQQKADRTHLDRGLLSSGLTYNHLSSGDG